MKNLLFEVESDITDDLVFYIGNKANILSQSDDFVIENFIDSEIFNPTILEFLETDQFLSFVGDLKGFESGLLSKLSINFNQEIQLKYLGREKEISFKKLKAKIRKLFCELIDQIENVSLSDIIKGILLAILPLFATGLPAIFVPLIIGFIALLLKRGYSRVCGN